MVLRDLWWIMQMREFWPWDRRRWFFSNCVQFRTSFGVWRLVVVPWLLSQHIEIGGETIRELRFLACICQLATAIIVINSDWWYVFLAKQVIIIFILKIMLLEMVLLCLQEISCVHVHIFDLIQMKSVRIPKLVSKDVFRPRTVEFVNVDVLYFCILTRFLSVLWADLLL